MAKVRKKQKGEKKKDKKNDTGIAGVSKMEGRLRIGRDLFADDSVGNELHRIARGQSLKASFRRGT